MLTYTVHIKKKKKYCKDTATTISYLQIKNMQMPVLKIVTDDAEEQAK